MIFWNVFIQVLLPLLIMFGAGWLLDRIRLLDLGTLVKLTVNLFVPAFIFYELVNAKINSALALQIVLFTIAVVVVLFILGEIIGRALGYTKNRKRSLQVAGMFYNSANYGIPTMHLAFPGISEVVQVFVILVQNVGNFTLGVFLFSSTHNPGWKALGHMFRQPSVWAVMLALLTRATGWQVQNIQWIWMPVDYFHRGLVGIALITLGVQLSQTRVKIPLRHLAWPVGLRLIGGPAVGFLLAWAFGFKGEIRDILVLSTSFPTAVNTALIAHEFKTDYEYAAATVFYSTLCSMGTVTVLIAFLKMSG